jgi:hypothetical protein
VLSELLVLCQEILSQETFTKTLLPRKHPSIKQGKSFAANKEKNSSTDTNHGTLVLSNCFDTVSKRGKSARKIE